MAVLESLGRYAGTGPDPTAGTTLVPVVKVGRDVTWASKHLAPWIGCRVTGRSSGDGVCAKRRFWSRFCSEPAVAQRDTSRSSQ